MRGLFRDIRPDVIFHLASHVKGAPNLEHVLPTFRSNLQSTVNLLTLAAEKGCKRMVITGSLAEPEPENGELFPSAPYAAAKWASSGYARMFHALYKLPVVIARVFMVYGPAQQDLTKLIPYVTLSLLRGEKPKISSGGRPVDWIYVSDVVDGFMALAEAPGIDGGTFEIGSGKPDFDSRNCAAVGGDCGSEGQSGVWGVARSSARAHADGQDRRNFCPAGLEAESVVAGRPGATVDWYKRGIGNVLRRCKKPSKFEGVLSDAERETREFQTTGFKETQ